MSFWQNRTPIVETAMNSAGGLGESVGASRFFVRTRRFVLRAALNSSEHRAFFLAWKSSYRCSPAGNDQALSKGRVERRLLCAALRAAVAGCLPAGGSGEG